MAAAVVELLPDAQQNTRRSLRFHFTSDLCLVAEEFIDNVANRPVHIFESHPPLPVVHWQNGTCGVTSLIHIRIARLRRNNLRRLSDRHVLTLVTHLSH